MLLAWCCLRLSQKLLSLHPRAGVLVVIVLPACCMPWYKDKQFLSPVQNTIKIPWWTADRQILKLWGHLLERHLFLPDGVLRNFRLPLLVDALGLQ